MFLLASLLLLVALPSVLSAVIDPLTCRSEGRYIALYHNNPGPGGCANLIYACRNREGRTHDVWSLPECVAAATCGGTSHLHLLLQCDDSSFEPTEAPSLDYSIYASIVGDCAWAEGGCPMTFQNYVDFVYGEMDAVGTSALNWPSSIEFVETEWWDYIANWTATGDTVPYLNFNDWLHYSNTV